LKECCTIKAEVSEEARRAKANASKNRKRAIIMGEEGKI
jgi:hypothetical protein